MTFVDSNVILDVVNDDPSWGDWSSSKLASAVQNGAVAINAIVYAEVSVQFESIEVLDAALDVLSIKRLPLPWEAGFLAGKCFVRYRRSGGMKTSPLPDFYIGAHAAVIRLPLLTRDAKMYRAYFPKLHLICP